MTDLWRDSADSADSTDLHRAIVSLVMTDPATYQSSDRVRVAIQQRIGQIAHVIEQVIITSQLCDAEFRQARLTRTQHHA